MAGGYISQVGVSLQRHRDLKAELLAQYPELASDDQALQDTLEGISDIDDVIAALINESLTRKALANGIIERIKELEARYARFDRGADKLRDAAEWAMQEANRIKITRPEFTASLGKSQPGVVIVDGNLIPPKFVKAKPEIDKKSIREALLTGVDVPGAKLGNPKLNLIVRTA